MAETPLLSVCIPIWNDEEFVAEALSSVLNQTYKNLEVIFSDNASDDRSVEIIRSFKDPRVKIYSNEKNMGGLYNFLKVMGYATGKYMTYLSADDKVDTSAYEKAIHILEDEKNQDIVLVNSHIEIINNHSEHVYTKKYLFGKGRISSYWGIRANLIYGSNILGEPNGSVWRSTAYHSIPEPKFKNGNGWTNDLDLKLELLLLGNTYMIAEPLGKFRISEDSNSNLLMKSVQAKLFREYAFNLYRDKRYKLSFGWVILASVTSYILQILRNVFYMIYIRKGKPPRVPAPVAGHAE